MKDVFGFLFLFFYFLCVFFSYLKKVLTCREIFFFQNVKGAKAKKQQPLSFHASLLYFFF